MIVLPLGPHRLFVASYYDRGFLRHHSSEKIVRAANLSTVHEAHARVYGSGAQHLPLVEKHLGRGAQTSGAA
jgi:hypothetical protein